MRLAYATDLHGDERKYAALLELARQGDAHAIVVGADILPKKLARDTYLGAQQAFTSKFFPSYLEGCRSAGLQFYTMPGNDDLAAVRPALVELERKKLLKLTDMKRLPLGGGCELIGYNRVPVTPFSIKDVERLDSRGWRVPAQVAAPLTSIGGYVEDIADLAAYLDTFPTIEEELAQLPRLRYRPKAVFSIHTPPAGCGLDVCGDGRRVGSEAVFRYLKREQPALSLHGHIHESPRVSGIWKTAVGNSVVIQPGQTKYGEELVAVLVDVEKPREARRVMVKAAKA